MSAALPDLGKRLTDMNQAIHRIESGGHTLQVKRPDLGFIAKLHAGRLHLTLNDGRQLQIVSLDLKDPANEKFLDQLSSGFTKELSLRSIEQAIVKAGCLVSALTQPFFKHMNNGRSNSLEVSAALDDKGQVKSLEALIQGGSQALQITEASELDKISAIIKKHVGYDKLGFEVQVARNEWHNLLAQHRVAFCSWLAAPPPAAPPPAAASSLEKEPQGEPRRLSLLEEILKKPVHCWKDELWRAFNPEELGFVNIGLGSATSASDSQQRARFQALIEEMNSKPWEQASARLAASSSTSPIASSLVGALPTQPPAPSSHASSLSTVSSVSASTLDRSPSVDSAGSDFFYLSEDDD